MTPRAESCITKIVNVFFLHRVRFQSRSFYSFNPLPSKFSENSDCRAQIALANLLSRQGFPSSHLQEFLHCNRYLLSYKLSHIEKSLSILQSLNLSSENLMSLVRACPSVLDHNFMNKWTAGFSEIGLSVAPPSMIRNILVCSKRFELDPNDLRFSVDILKRFRLKDDTIIKVLDNLPEVMLMKEEELKEKFDFVTQIGFANGIDWVCYSYPMFLMFSVKRRLKPLIDEFTLGFSVDLVKKEILREPRILGMEVGELSRCLNFVKSLKCWVPIKMKILKNGVLRAGFELKLRIDCLCRYGLTTREALEILSKEPRAITYDINEIEKKIGFLVDEMKFDVDCLLDAPQYLGLNFGKQIVPRYDVIRYLKSKGGLGGDVGLREIMKISRKKFYNMYVKPYPECENMYGKLYGRVVEPQYPFGLWRLLKPRNYPQSKEELSNLRCFMAS